MFRPSCGNDTAMPVPIMRMALGAKAKPPAATPKLKQPKAPPKLLVGSTMKPGAKQEVDEDDVSEEMLDMAYTR